MYAEGNGASELLTNGQKDQFAPVYKTTTSNVLRMKVGRCACVSFGLSVLVGLTLVVTGVVLLTFVLHPTVERKIHQGLVLQKGSEASQRFASPPVPTYIRFYFFNVTNKDEVNTNKDAKAVLQELGPYVYRQEKNKTILEWDEKRGTVFYKEYSEFYFEEKMSTGSLSDSINHVNIAGVIADKLVGASNVARDDRIESNTVNELLFGGFEIDDYFTEETAAVCHAILPGCLFGLYLGKNQSISKEFEVSTGIWSMKDFGDIKQFNKKRKLDYWYSDTCNAINGTDGKQFPPGVDKTMQLYVFSADVCRSLTLEYEKDVTVEGIPALRFGVPSHLFANPNKNRDNMCFCGPNTTTCPWPAAGIMPLSNCRKGLPIVASSPHFYQGDQHVWERHINLKPVKEKHETFLDIEPMTGTVISAAKRIQISLQLVPDPNFPIFDVPEVTYFPIFWVEETGTIDSSKAALFRQKLLTPYRTGKWSLITVIVVGGLMTLAGLIMGYLKMTGAKCLSRSRNQKKVLF